MSYWHTIMQHISAGHSEHHLIFYIHAHSYIANVFVCHVVVIVIQLKGASKKVVI